jgi:DNA-binding transcriptional ArsR family regulator
MASPQKSKNASPAAAPRSRKAPAGRKPQPAKRNSTSKPPATSKPSSRSPKPARRRPGRGASQASGKGLDAANTIPRRTSTRQAARLEALFPKLAKPGNWYGLASLCAVAEADGHRPRVRVARRESLFDNPARQPQHTFSHTIDPQRLARLFSALANPHRIAMLNAMFAGAGTYAQLAEQLGLKAGPLYHHVRELRLAGLVALQQRDLYRLTDRGKDALMLASCFHSLLAKA